MSTGATAGAVKMVPHFTGGAMVKDGIASKATLRLIFEGSGPIQIPVDWDELYWPQEYLEQKPFVLTESKAAFAKRRAKLWWGERAKTEEFWQCFPCYVAAERKAWCPWPRPVIFCGEQARDTSGELAWDDDAWGFFSELDWDTRERFRLQSVAIIWFKREVSTTPRVRIKNAGNHAFRIMSSQRHGTWLKQG